MTLMSDSRNTSTKLKRGGTNNFTLLPITFHLIRMRPINRNLEHNDTLPPCGYAGKHGLGLGYIAECIRSSSDALFPDAIYSSERGNAPDNRSV